MSLYELNSIFKEISISKLLFNRKNLVYVYKMVLLNSASRSRNMGQTNNLPQAADFGDLMPVVGYGAYGSRNRRQRGVGNITLWSTTRMRSNHGRNIGRDLVAARGSAWNARGTSANTILINEVNDAQGVYAKAVAADTAAEQALSAASDALYEDPAADPLVPKAKSAIENLMTTSGTNARKLLLDFLDKAGSSQLNTDIASIADATDKQNAENKRDELHTAVENVTTLDAATYDPESAEDVAKLKTLVAQFNTEVQNIADFLALYSLSTSAPDVSSLITAASDEVSNSETYFTAVATEAATKTAEAAALVALQKAQAAVY